MQQSLFEVETEQKPKQQQGLTITKAGKQTLTKNQQAFNKLTQKIERLHKEVEKKQFQFDTALSIYGKELHPIKSQLAKYQRNLVSILWEIFQNKKLAKADQRPLKQIIKDHVLELIRHTEGGPDEELKKIYSQLEGESFDKLQQRENDWLKNDVQDLMDELDMDIDFNEVDVTDEKAMAEKLAEIQQKMREQEENMQQSHKRTKRKKKLTPKQEESERMRKAVEEMKQKNISTIYRQLAKLFHPDLEHDEERRAEKEILMKELTAAYEAKNLHTLLTLELRWIHKENDHLETLGEEKLAIYLEILREQARDLEQEVNGMFQQPRYQVLLQEFGFDIQRYPLEVVKDQVRHLKNIEKAFKRDLENFQSPFALRYIKALIKEWKLVQRQNNALDDKFFRDLF